MHYVFQLSPTAKDIATSVCRGGDPGSKPTKVAMLNENTDSGRDFSRNSEAMARGQCAEDQVVADDFVARGVPDLTPQIAKFKRLGAGAIVGEIYGTAAPVLFRQWNELRVPARSPTWAPAPPRTASCRARRGDGRFAGQRPLDPAASITDLSEPMVEAYKKKTGSRRRTSRCRRMTRALVALEAIRTPAQPDPTRSPPALRAATFTAAWGQRQFTLAEGHRMPVETVVVAGPGRQEGRRSIPHAVARRPGRSYKPVPP